MNMQSLAILVENRAGVLTRVTNLFARRGYNIESLAVGMTQNPAVSRITIAVRGDLELVEQIIRQLHKLPDVLMVRHLNISEHFARELIFIKVAAPAARRAEIMQIADIFRGHIIDVSSETLTVELSGGTEKIEALRDMLEPYGILELVRTGSIAIERGMQTMNIERSE